MCGRKQRRSRDRRLRPSRPSETRQAFRRQRHNRCWSPAPYHAQEQPGAPFLPRSLREKWGAGWFRFRLVAQLTYEVCDSDTSAQHVSWVPQVSLVLRDLGPGSKPKTSLRSYWRNRGSVVESHPWRKKRDGDGAPAKPRGTPFFSGFVSGARQLQAPRGRDGYDIEVRGIPLLAKAARSGAPGEQSLHLSQALSSQAGGPYLRDV